MPGIVSETKLAVTMLKRRRKARERAKGKDEKGKKKKKRKIKKNICKQHTCKHQNMLLKANGFEFAFSFD